MTSHDRNLLRAARFIRRLNDTAEGDLVIDGEPASEVAWSLETVARLRQMSTALDGALGRAADESERGMEGADPDGSPPRSESSAGFSVKVPRCVTELTATEVSESLRPWPHLRALRVVDGDGA